MVFNNEKISPRQLYRLIVMATTGITCILETELCVKYAGGYGILCLLFQMVLTILYTGLILFSCDKCDWNFLKYKNRFINFKTKKIIYFIFMVKYFLLTIFAISYLIKLIRIDLLKEMGYMGILIPTLFLVIYSVSKGIEARARLAELMVYFICIFILLLSILSINNLEFRYVIQPELGSVSGIFIGGVVLFLLFSPVEILLFMTDKFTTDKNSVVSKKKVKLYKKSVWMAVITAFVLNIIYYVVCTGVLSTNVIIAKNEAVILLAKNVKMPYIVFEKQDGIFMAFFVIGIFFTAFCLAHQTLFLGEKLFGKINRLSFIALFLFLFMGCFLVINNSDFFTSIKDEKEKRVEIENRAYADSIYIDYVNEKFNVALIFPNEKSVEDVMKIDLNSLKEIEEEYLKKSNKILDISHVQVVFINEKIITNEILFKHIFYFVESKDVFSDNMTVCALTQNRDEFIENIKELNPAPGRYISKMLENNTEIKKMKLRDFRLLMFDAIDTAYISVFEAGDKRLEYMETKKISRNE